MQIKTFGTIDLKSKFLNNNTIYRSKGSFDWYIGWNELKPNVEHLINKESKILIVGCGNSSKYLIMQ